MEFTALRALEQPVELGDELIYFEAGPRDLHRTVLRWWLRYCLLGLAGTGTIKPRDFSHRANFHIPLLKSRACFSRPENIGPRRCIRHTRYFVVKLFTFKRKITLSTIRSKLRVLLYFLVERLNHFVLDLVVKEPVETLVLSLCVIPVMISYSVRPTKDFWLWRFLADFWLWFLNEFYLQVFGPIFVNDLVFNRELNLFGFVDVGFLPCLRLLKVVSFCGIEVKVPVSLRSIERLALHLRVFVHLLRVVRRILRWHSFAFFLISRTIKLILPLTAESPSLWLASRIRLLYNTVYIKSLSSLLVWDWLLLAPTN